MIYDPKLRQLLLEKGLTKQQVDAPVAEKMVEIFGDGNTDGAFSLLFDELGKKTAELERERANLVAKINYTKQKLEADFASQFEAYTETFKSISEVIDEYGPITDSKAKNALSLFAAIARIGKDLKGDANKSLTCASYIAYAYLAGENAKDMTLNSSEQEAK